MKIVLFSGDPIEVQCASYRCIHGDEKSDNLRIGDELEDRVEQLRLAVHSRKDLVPLQDLRYAYVDIPDESSDYKIRVMYFDNETQAEEYVEYVINGKIHEAFVETYELWRDF